MDAEGQACPMPRRPDADEAEAISRMLDAQRIAVVGLSDDPSKPSNYVSAYLAEHGKQIVPVNPTIPFALGRKSLNSLADLDAPVDVVLVFRLPRYCPQVAEEARGKAKGIWLQSGIRSAEARQIAEAAGMDYVEDRCMMVEHSRRRG
jgi:predicted CoA-binding protein